MAAGYEGPRRFGVFNIAYLTMNRAQTPYILGDGATAGKIKLTMGRGTGGLMIPIPLGSVREVGTNDIQNLAGHGGIMAKDSTPIYEFANGDTDSVMRLHWAASDSNAIAFQTSLPSGYDPSVDLVMHIRAAMAGATDTPVLDLDTFFNEGDTKVSDAAAAVTGTTYADYPITIAAADIPAAAKTVSFELTPAAHTTDALYVTAIDLQTNAAKLYYLIDGLQYELAGDAGTVVADDLFDASALTDLVASTYCKLLLTLDSSGTGYVTQGAIKASQAAAPLPWPARNRSVVGYCECGDGGALDWDAAGGLVSEGVTYVEGYNMAQV
jgi:hypothetical protein